MKAFVSYSHKTNIADIFHLLKEVGIDFYDGNHDLNIGNSLQEAISNGVKNCDFFIAIYDFSNPNIAFESGLAYALKKPMFVIINPDIDTDIPDFLMDSVHVFANPSDYEKIKYNFDIFLENIKPTKSKTAKKKKNSAKSYTQKRHSEKWLKAFNTFDLKNEIRLERLIGEILKENKIEIVKDKWSSQNKYLSDFCIWSDQLSHTFGNPILIEVKKTLSRKYLESTNNKVRNTLSHSNAKSVIVFYNELANINENELNSFNSRQLIYINIFSFLKELDKNDFNKALLKCRNDLIHNIS